MTAPQGSADVAEAQRIIHADVADVYNAIDRVEQWSAWMTSLTAPMSEVGHQAYEFSSTQGATTRRHRMVIRAQGPVHSFVAELDGQCVLDFRCTPHVPGTSVKISSRQLGKRKWRERISARRRTERCSTALESVLDQLAVHLENTDR